jgi:hypothetical protein
MTQAMPNIPPPPTPDDDDAAPSHGADPVVPIAEVPDGDFVPIAETSDDTVVPLGDGGKDVCVPITSPCENAIVPMPLESVRGGWWQCNWKWAVPAGVVLCVLGIVGLFVGIFAIIVGVMRSTDVYQTAISEARGEPAVVAAIGLPIEEGLLFAGEIEVNGDWGNADIAIPIEGPTGRATIYAEATRSRGDWYYTTLVVEFDDGRQPVDLMWNW